MLRGHMFPFGIFTNSVTTARNLLDDDDSNGSRVHADFLAVFSSTPSAAAADSFVIITVIGGGGGSELQPHSPVSPTRETAPRSPPARPAKFEPTDSIYEAPFQIHYPVVQAL